METTREQALSIYAHIRSAHHQAFVEMDRLKTLVGKELEVGATCDAIGVLKRSEELLKSASYEVNQAIKQLSKVACALYLRDGNTGEPVRTEWLTATPDTKSVPTLPKRDKDPEKYAAMAEFFGVPQSAWGVFRPHWPDMKEYITQCEAESKPLPPGIDADTLKTEYVVICRWKKDVEPDTLV